MERREIYPKKISVVIPARNEEESLPLCISALSKSAEIAQCEIEIIVVVNRSTDRTEDIALQSGCTVVKNDAKNLSIIRNAGVKRASNEFIVTVDADSYVSENMLQEVCNALEKAHIVGGGVMMYPSRYSLGICLTGFFLLPIALWYRISAGLFFFRRKDFDAIGGFNEELVSVEDIDFARRLRQYGKDTRRKYTTLFSAYIITSTRKFDHFGDWYFLLRPHLLWRLFKGTDKEAANSFWYNFKR